MPNRCWLAGRPRLEVDLMAAGRANGWTAVYGAVYERRGICDTVVIFRSEVRVPGRAGTAEMSVRFLYSVCRIGPTHRHAPAHHPSIIRRMVYVGSIHRSRPPSTQTRHQRMEARTAAAAAAAAAQGAASKERTRLCCSAVGLHSASRWGWAVCASSRHHRWVLVVRDCWQWRGTVDWPINPDVVTCTPVSCKHKHKQHQSYCITIPLVVMRLAPKCSSFPLLNFFRKTF